MLAAGSSYPLEQDMQLFDIPAEVWQCILLQWIVLPGLVRFDLAVSQPRLNNPLLTLYSGQHLVNYWNRLSLRDKHVDKLFDWMRSRDVYLKQFAYLGLNSNSPQWLHILEWIRKKVQSLTMTYARISENNFASLVVNCTNLIELTLKNCVVGSKDLHAVLFNNATSLKRLELNLGQLTDDDWKFPILPQLKIAELVMTNRFGSAAIPILSACSQLTSL